MGQSRASQTDDPREGPRFEVMDRGSPDLQQRLRELEAENEQLKREIEEERESKRLLQVELERQQIDPRSGLFNQSTFEEGLPRIENYEGSAMALFDLANLKLVNDLVGYDIGNDLIRMVGDAMLKAAEYLGLPKRMATRASNGDEFGFFCGAGDSWLVVAAVEHICNQAIVEKYGECFETGMGKFRAFLVGGASEERRGGHAEGFSSKFKAAHHSLEDRKREFHRQEREAGRLVGRSDYKERLG